MHGGGGSLPVAAKFAWRGGGLLVAAKLAWRGGSLLVAAKVSKAFFLLYFIRVDQLPVFPARWGMPQVAALFPNMFGNFYLVKKSQNC